MAWLKCVAFEILKLFVFYLCLSLFLLIYFLYYLVVSTSAVNWLERLVPEMTCYMSSGTLNSHLLTFAYILLCEILIRYFSSVYCRCLSGVYFCTWCAVFLSLLFYRHMSVSFLLRIFVDSLRVAHCTADNDKRSVTVGIAVCRLMHMTMVLAKLQKMKTLM